MTYGTITAVEAANLGSELVADAVVGATVLAVDYVGDFDEDGGSLLLNGATLSYSTVDVDANTITLSVGIAAAASVGDPVQVVEAGSPAVEWLAHVALAEGEGDGGGDTSDTVAAVIPTALVGYFPEGTYDEPVPVEVQTNGDTFVVVTQPQQPPTFSGALLDPSTVPTPHDGVVPGAVGTAITLGGLGLIFVKWSPVTLNALGGPQVDPVRYRVHVSTTNPVPINDTTLVADTGGTLAVVKALADGTEFSYDTSYYFAVEAYDEDGRGAASPSVSGAMDRTASGDLAAQSVTAAQLAGILVLGSTISTRGMDADGNLTGAGLDLTPDGLFSYDSTGGKRVELPNTGTYVFRGDAEIDHLTVQTLTTLQATVLAQGATLTMATGVTAPNNPPTVTIGYSNTQHTDDGYWANRYGLAYDGTYWYTHRTSGGGAVYWEQWTAAGKLNAFYKNYGSWGTTTTDTQAFGVTYANGKLYWLSLDVDGASFNIVESTTALVPTGNFWTIPGNVNVGTRIWWDSDADTPSTLGPALGYDSAAGQFLLAQVREDNGNKVRVQRFTLTGTGQYLTPTWGTTFNTTYAYQTSAGAGYNLSFISYGSFDFGSARYVFGNFGSAMYQVVTTAGALDTANQWDNGTTATRGLWWDGVNFYVTTSTGKRLRYEAGNKWTATADATWYVAYAWRNATTPAETVLSPVTTFTMKKRARVQAYTPALPAGVTEARVYYSKGATAPDTTKQSMTAAGSTTGTTQPSLLSAAVLFTPLNNFTVPTFGSAAPALVQSTATDSAGALVKLSGDGSARLGPLSLVGSSGVATVKASGTGFDMRKLVQSGVVNITPSGANVQTSQAVVFDVPFDSIPNVVVGVNTGSATVSITAWCGTGSITKTGCTVSLSRGNTTSTALTWVAVATN